VIPLEAGGQYVVSNGIVLCRTCEIVAGVVGAGKPLKRRPIDFHMSRRAYDTLQQYVGEGFGLFSSANALIRYMVSKFVRDPSQFDDLGQYQDVGAAEVKFNVWINEDIYRTFKAILDERRYTVTDALKGLIFMYDSIRERGV
jgi:hypothetical protein